MDPANITDEHRSELTFEGLDELARAAERKRVDPRQWLAARRVARLGPLIELLLLHRRQTLPLDALAADPAVAILRETLSATRSTHGVYRTDLAAIGMITTGRDIDDAASDGQLHWVGFGQRAQQAAERCMPKPIAQGLVGAMLELEDNVHVHSQRPRDGVAAFRGTAEEFEFVVADSGIGTLASLRQSPAYRDLVDAGTALRLALQDGESRLKHDQPDRGYGFRHLFRNIAALNASLRFRSDDQAVTMQGVGLEPVHSTLSQKTPLQGFAASIVCRPLAKAR